MNTYKVIKFQCRTRLFGWCSPAEFANEHKDGGSFNAARGCFLSPPPPLRGPPPPLAQGRLGYAPFSRRITQYQLPPPMRGKWRAQRADRGAHAARGFVSGAALTKPTKSFRGGWFQCRTRLCGWCNVLCTVSIIAETTPNDKCFPMQQKSR